MADHGTLTRYRHGCDCASCREANALHVARWRSGRSPVPKSAPDTLAVTCWCEAKVVGVPTEDVAVGMTRSCGLPDCRQPVAA